MPKIEKISENLRGVFLRMELKGHAFKYWSHATYR